MDKTKININNLLFTLYKIITENLYFNTEIINIKQIYLYIYICCSKKISYILHKKKILKMINIQETEISYPKYSYINNQKNTYKKYINIFKNFDFYSILNQNNFILFVKSILYDIDNNQHILNNLDKNDINILKKLILFHN